MVGVLVGSGFEVRPELAAADKRVSLLSCSLLDDVIFCESSACFSYLVLCDEDLVVFFPLLRHHLITSVPSCVVIFLCFSVCF